MQGDGLGRPLALWCQGPNWCPPAHFARKQLQCCFLRVHHRQLQHRLAHLFGLRVRAKVAASLPSTSMCVRL